MSINKAGFLNSPLLEELTFISSLQSEQKEIFHIWNRTCQKKTSCSILNKYVFIRSLEEDEICKVDLFANKVLSINKSDAELSKFKKNATYFLEGIRTFKQESEKRYEEIKKELTSYPFKQNFSKNIAANPYLTKVQKEELVKIVLKDGFWFFQFYYESLQKVSDNEKMSMFLKYFDIKEFPLSFELVKLMAAWLPIAVSKQFHQYGIKDQDQKFQIAKIAMERGPTFIDISQYIDNYNLTKNQLYEIAKIIIVRHSYSSAAFEFITKIDFQKKDQLFEIAKMAAKEACETSRNIHVFKLDLDQRFEIAKIAAFYKASSLCIYIKNYEIKDKNQLFEIAQIAARNTSSMQIVYFELDKEQKYEIAKIAAKKDSIYIPDYGIEDNAKRFEIAKIVVASQGPYGNLLDWLNKYDLTPDQEYEIKKISAARQGLLTFNKLEKSNSKSDLSDNFFEITKIALMSPDGYKIKFGWHPFEQTKKSILIDIYIQGSLKSFLKKLESTLPEDFHILLHEYEEPMRFNSLDFKNLQVSSKTLPVNALSLILNSNESAVPHTLPLLKEPVFLPHEFESPLLKYMNEPKVRFWAGCYLLRCQLANERYEEYRKELSDPSLLTAFAKLHIPVKRLQLTRMLFEQLTEDNKEAAELYNKLGTKKFAHKYPLFRILLTHLIDSYAKEFRLSSKEALTRWNSVFSVLESAVYKDSRAQMILINSLYSLISVKQHYLEDKGKVDLALGVLESGEHKKGKERIEHVNRNFAILLSLIDSNQLEVLSQLAKKMHDSKFPSPDSLQRSLQEVFQKIVGEVDIKEYSEKYEKTFLKSRQPNAFFTYASRLQGCNSLKAHFRTLYTAILEGNFNELRYETKPEDHLSTIFSWNPHIKETWAKRTCINLVMKSEDDDKSSSLNDFNVRQYLRERICQDKHISENEYAILADYLENADGRISLEDSLKTLDEQEKQAQEEITFREKEKKIKLQRTLIELTVSQDLQKKLSNLKDAINCAKEIFNENHQFVTDLRDLEKLLQAEGKPQVQKGLRVEDTDHWEDLLLCGTEVIGSCQNINGDSQYNVCLLNYILDGKIRIVALKDSAGRIQARAMIRLLWDDKSKQPVLYRERLYRNPGVLEKNIRAIDQMCLAKAKAMGIPLVRTKEEKDFPGRGYPHPLISLNGRAPHEYVDAGSLGQTNGKYTIPSKEIVRMDRWNSKATVLLVVLIVGYYFLFYNKLEIMFNRGK